MWKRLRLLMAWPWKTPLYFLGYPRSNIIFFCLLRQICFLTLLYMLKALFLDEHNTSGNVTRTNMWFYTQYMTGANCSQSLGGRTLSEFPAFHIVLLLSHFYSRQATLCRHYSWDQFKEVHFHWNAIFIIQLKPKGQIPYQYKHLGVLM